MAVDWKTTYQVINEDTLRLAENAPMLQPDIAPHNDETRDNNNLLGKVFQFAYQWVYKDYRHSILSPYSNLFVSKELTKDILSYDQSIENNVTITVPLGNSEVISVNILAREGNSGSWFYCNKYAKDKHVDDSFYTFTFYDDSVREYIDLTSALATYHNVPRDAKNAEVVENKIVLSNCTTGYNPHDVQYDLSIAYGDEPSESTSINYGDITLVNTNNNHHTALTIHFVVPTVTMGQTVVVDIRWKADFLYNTDSGFLSQAYIERHSYNMLCSKSFYATKNYSPSEFQTVVLDVIKNGMSFTREVKTPFPGYPLESSVAVSFGSWTVVRTPIGTNEFKLTADLTGIDQGKFGPDYVSPPSGSYKMTLTTGQGFQNTFKKYSSYNVGVAYYDKVGRTSGVLTSVNKAIYVPGAILGTPVTYEDRPTWIKCKINSAPPSWASYYRFCVSESVSFVDTYSTHTNSNCYEVELDGRTVLALDIYTKNYSFLQGDLLIKETATGVLTKPILGTRAVVTIPDPNDVTKTIEKSGNYILVPKEGSTLVLDTPADANYMQCKLSIHRMKSTHEDTVYFEDLFTGTITNGAHSDSERILKCGDAWIKTRVYTYTPDEHSSPYTFSGEEFDINTELGIRAYPKGRPMVSLKDFGQKTQPITMWGGNYFRDTKTNEISAFNFEDTMMLDAQHGDINQMWLVGDVMKFLQVRKETSVYVGKSTFTDAGGNVSLAQVNSLFGNKNESTTDYGLNFKKGCTKSERLMFYWDQDKGAVVQSSPNGLLEISRYGMQSYFRDKKRAIDAVLGDPTKFDVVFGYDTHNGELIALFRVNFDIEAVVFDPERNEWTRVVDLSKAIFTTKYNPDAFMTLGSSMFTTLGGLMYQHNPVDTQAGENNKIYDETKPIIITGVLNAVPTVEKELKSMSMDADGSVFVEATTPVSSTSSKGQYTYVNPQSYVNKSGRKYSAFLRNIRVANGNDTSLLLSGSRMKGRHAEISVRSNVPAGFEFRDLQVNWLAV